MNKDKVRELTEDYIFKRVFGKKENEDLLKDLLESILEIKIAQIEVIIGTEIEKEKGRINSERFEDYDMNNVWDAHEDIRSLKSLILFGIKGMAAYAYHALVLGKTDDEVNDFFIIVFNVLNKNI